MIDVPAAASLLLANLVIVLGVLALSATLRRMDPPTGKCHLCSTAEASATVRDEPICAACKREYYASVQ